MRLLFTAALCIAIVLAVPAQSYKDKRNAPVTIRGNIGIPKPVSSQMFRKSFTGIAEGNISVNFRTFGNFYIGAGYDLTFLRNNDFLRFEYFQNQIPYNTRLLGHSGFLRLGIDRFFSERGYVSYALYCGLMDAQYRNVNADTSALNRPYGKTKFTSLFLQPEVSINFIAERNLAFSFMISYMNLLDHYDPKAPRFKQFDEIRSAKNRHIMSWINFGFGFNVLLGKH